MEEGKDALGEGLREEGGGTAGEVRGGAAGCEFEVWDEEGEVRELVRVLFPSLPPLIFCVLLVFFGGILLFRSRVCTHGTD